MNSEQGRLTDLHDIVLPDPVGFWPPDTGGLLVLGGILICIGLIGLHRYLRRRRDRYRRAGILVLEGAATVRDVSVVLKRVALAAYPRDQVASLYGNEWVAFLNGTCSGTVFDSSTFASPADPPSAELLQSARCWIKSHDVKAASETASEGN